MTEQDFDNPRVLEMPKPFLLDFYVPYSVYDPTFHTRKMTKDPTPLDPCCTSCRIPDDKVTIYVYVSDESYRVALDFITSHATEIEAALTAKLQAVQERYIVEHLEENLPGMTDWQKHWDYIVSKLGSPIDQRIDRMFKLTGISIVRADPENEWVVGYEFQTAWDMDHGLEIVMWNEKVLTADGMLVITSTGRSVFAGVRENQKYVLDAVDYRLA